MAFAPQRALSAPTGKIGGRKRRRRRARATRGWRTGPARSSARRTSGAVLSSARSLARSPVRMQSWSAAAWALHHRVWVGAGAEQRPPLGRSLERFDAGVVQPRLGKIEMNACAVDRAATVATCRRCRQRATLQALGAVDVRPASAEPVTAARTAALGRFDLVGELPSARHTPHTEHRNSILASRSFARTSWPFRVVTKSRVTSASAADRRVRGDAVCSHRTAIGSSLPDRQLLLGSDVRHPDVAEAREIGLPTRPYVCEPSRPHEIGIAVIAQWPVIDRDRVDG